MSDHMLIDFTGEDEVEAALQDYLQQVRTAIKQRYEQAGKNTYDDSQENVPVDKGDLKRSGHISDESSLDQIQIDVTYGEGEEGTIGYAWYQELGFTSRDGTPVAPQPYLGPAFERKAEALLSDLPAILEG